MNQIISAAAKDILAAALAEMDNSPAKATEEPIEQEEAVEAPVATETEWKQVTAVPERKPSMPMFASSGDRQTARATEPSPLSEAEPGRVPMFVQSTRCQNEANVITDHDAHDAKKDDTIARKPLMVSQTQDAQDENSPASRTNWPVVPPVVVKKDPSERSLRGSSPRFPPNSWASKTAKAPNSTTAQETVWLKLDSLRVRCEMLPGGLVRERDDCLKQAQELITEIQRDAVSGCTEVKALLRKKLEDIEKVLEEVEAECRALEEESVQQT